LPAAIAALRSAGRTRIVQIGKPKSRFTKQFLDRLYTDAATRVAADGNAIQQRNLAAPWIHPNEFETAYVGAFGFTLPEPDVLDLLLKYCGMQARDNFTRLRVGFIGLESCLARLQHVSEDPRNSGCMVAHLQDYCELGYHARVKGPHQGRLLREYDADVSVAGPSDETADGASVERPASPTLVARLLFEQWPRAWNDASENHGPAPPFAQPQYFNTKCQDCHYDDRSWRWKCLVCGLTRML
jgi:hypothetical protein